MILKHKQYGTKYLLIYKSELHMYCVYLGVGTDFKTTRTFTNYSLNDFWLNP